VNRIQLIDESADQDDVEDLVGSNEVRQAALSQRRFYTEVDPEHDPNKKPLALWLSLDPLSGEVSLYPRAAATRLEAAYVNRRSNVPLAGLGGDLEDGIVFLGAKGQHPVQKSWDGGQMDVRRLQVPSCNSEVTINVVQDHGWRIAEVAIPGTTEERRVVLNGTEMVRPPTPPLPPVNPDRRAFFMNAGACRESDWD
jgi:hypothetical protein